MMIEIKNIDYDEYVRNCNNHQKMPNDFISWRLEANRVNFRIASLMDSLE